MTEVEDIGLTHGDAAEASVEHCIITLSRTRTAGRSAFVPF